MNAAFLVNPFLRRQFDAASARRIEAGTAHAADVGDRQLAALQPVWADAISDVPYYRQLVETGRAPRVIREWSDVACVPVLTRRLLQERPHDFIRESGPPASFITTAGSTGTPLSMGMNQAERDLMRVVKLSAWQAFGYQPSSRLFLIWGHAHLLGTGWKGRFNHFKRRLADRALGYRRVDAYRLTVDSCADYAEQLIAFKPIGLIGYGSALDLFVRYTAGYRERFRRLGLRFVLSTAEAPPRPDTIEMIEDHFACPVVQEYGGAEFGQVAFKVGARPFETYADLNFVEAETADADGQDGRPILVTSLYPRYLPLVRYRVGDGVEGAEVEPHGHVARFAAVAGRINDVIHLADGDAIHSVAVFHCIHQEPVHNIQMVLHDDRIEVCLVSPATDRPAMESRIRSRLRQVHPALGGVHFIYREDLESNRAGKRRWFIDRRTTKPSLQ